MLRAVMDTRQTQTYLQLGGPLFTLNAIKGADPDVEGMDTPLDISNSVVPATDAEAVRVDQEISDLQYQLTQLEKEANWRGYDIDATIGVPRSQSVVRTSVDVDEPLGPASLTNGYEDSSWLNNDDSFKRGRCIIEEFTTKFYHWLNVGQYDKDRFIETIIPWLNEARMDGYHVPILNPPLFPNAKVGTGVSIVRLALD
eukprot:5982896-Prymnesium_polylepis.1